jgi:endonuclease/exonuclease/phosphatase family metal-dependent hydrolase
VTRSRFVVAAAWAVATACSSATASPPLAPPSTTSTNHGLTAIGGAPAGRLTVLTYNVAGLPDAVSRRTPSVSMPLIGRRLDAYELVFVQEDFAHSDLLAAAAHHPHRSRNEARGFGLGDGLTMFSARPLAALEREPWSVCNGLLHSGSDCLTPKGFTRTTVELAPGAPVDLYNLHMDAGRAPADRAARLAQAQQLVAAIARHSADRAVIVAGDTNLRPGRDDEALAELEAAGLRDACAATDCAQQLRPAARRPRVRARRRRGDPRAARAPPGPRLRRWRRAAALRSRRGGRGHRLARAAELTRGSVVVVGQRTAPLAAPRIAFGLAVGAQRRVGHERQAARGDLLVALLAPAEALGRLGQQPQRAVDPRELLGLLAVLRRGQDLQHLDQRLLVLVGDADRRGVLARRLDLRRPGGGEVRAQRLELLAEPLAPLPVHVISPRPR